MAHRFSLWPPRDHRKKYTVLVFTYLSHSSNADLKLHAHRRMLFIPWFAGAQSFGLIWKRMRNLFSVNPGVCFLYLENRNSFRIMIRGKDGDSWLPRCRDVQHVVQEVKCGEVKRGHTFFQIILLKKDLSHPTPQHVVFCFQSKCYQTRGHPTKSNSESSAVVTW